MELLRAFRRATDPVPASIWRLAGEPELAGGEFRMMGDCAVHLEQRGAYVVVQWLYATKPGAGLAAMRRVCRLADAHDVPLFLNLGYGDEALVLFRLGFRHYAPHWFGDQPMVDRAFCFIRRPGGARLQAADIRFAKRVEQTAELTANFRKIMAELYAGNYDCLDDPDWLRWAHAEAARAEAAQAAPRKATKKLKSVLMDQLALVAPPEERQRERKLGRNEPCDCGSGRKAKRCCGAGYHAEAA